MKEFQILLVLSPVIILIFLFSYLLTKSIGKINKKYKKYPTYWLFLFISGLAIIFLAFIKGTDYPTLLLGIASSTAGAYAKFRKKLTK